MATVPSNPDSEIGSLAAAGVPPRPRGSNPVLSVSGIHATEEGGDDSPRQKPSQHDALQALLAFSALHEQVRRRKALAARHNGFDAGSSLAEFDAAEQFVLDEVLQLVAERAVAITGADGLAIALAEDNQIVLRAAAGTVRPDVGARIDRDSAFSGASFRTAQIVNCDDTETDPRVNLQACRRLGARSMVAVPLCGRRRVIGLLEAFSTWPFAFNDSDIRNLSLLAELVVGALKPEDEDRFAEAAQVAETHLEKPTAPPVPPVPAVPPVSAAPGAPPAEITRAKASPPIASQPLARTKTEVAPAVVSAVANAPATQNANVPEFEPPVLVVPSSGPQLKFGMEPEKSFHHSGILILAISTVILSAFAAGIWWKLKTAQVGSQTISTERTAAADRTQSSSGSLTIAPSEARDKNAAIAANSGMNSDTAEAAVNPATPGELAKFPRITGIRHWSSADTTTIVLDLEDQVQYEAHRLTGPDRIYFDLHDTQLGPELLGKSIEFGDAVLNRIRMAQPVAGMTRVVLETKANPNFSVSLEPNPYRLVVEVRKIGANPRGTVNLFPNVEAEKNRLAIVIPPPTKEDMQWRARVPKMRIVVDAGHGGWDLGTVGRRGLLEKDLVLEIAERLGKLLEGRLGMDVIYTRQDDNYIPLDERAEIANHAQADLFISVHANYSDLASARGVETYYTNTFSAPGSKEAGAKDADAHATVGGSKNSVLPALSSADLHERVEQSRHLAASVQRSLYGTLSAQNSGLRDRGIKEAGFVVLTESAMPGILAEVSFVSSPTDEQKLRSDGYREQIAEALYRGIARYAASSHPVKVASAGK
jgi:N-acetylmuramoyl-L-alanine amidase/putative methionine-R-sulfoxide reductase with GAF domain